MPKQIKLELSVESIDRAINEIYARRAEIKKRVEQLIDKMVAAGELYAIKEIFDHVYTGETISSIMGYRDGNKGVIMAGGAAVWLEFGTGVIKNTKVHPKAAELGMSAWGTYGNGHGSSPYGWWYEGDDGDYHHTQGITATMFMYRTAQYLKEQFETMGREVFK